jgi:hypothetical protein
LEAIVERIQLFRIAIAQLSKIFHVSLAKSIPVGLGDKRGLRLRIEGYGDVKNVIYATHAGGPVDGYDVGFRILRDIK